MCAVKSWRTLGLALVLALAGSGCGGGNGASTSAPIPPSSASSEPGTPPPPAAPILPTVPTTPTTPSTCTAAISEAPAAVAVTAPPAPAGLAVATSTRFVGSGACAACHRTDTTTNPATNVDLASGEAVGIVNDWAGTMMANAARDPLFLAALRAEMTVIADQSAVQRKCLTCHAPMASYEARRSGAVFGLTEMYASELGRDGVSCSLCHRIEVTGLGSDATYSGNFNISDETGSARRVYGPFADVAINPMVNRVSMTPAYAAHVRESGMCAACHTLRTEAVDPASRELTGVIFPEQMPYKEWLASSFAQKTSCQGCHLPTGAGAVRLSNLGPARGQVPFGKHHLVGGNAFMLNMLRQDRAAANSLQLIAESSNFEAAIARTEIALVRNTATLAVSACRSAASLNVDVTVTNLTGHKLPTGYPNRRLWLHLKVVDAAGAVVFESGAADAQGEIIGLDAEYEPHYQTIQRPDQVQVYEAVMGDISNRMTLRLMHAARYLKDNRLLPDGMARDVADAEIRPVGVAADADFGSGRDQLTYVIAIGSSRAPLSIEVELLYQAAPPRHVAGLSADSSNETAHFAALYVAADKSPRRVAKVSAALN